MHLQAFESFPWLWKPPARAALESNQELARKSLHVRNHALTNAGKHILLNRCCAWLKRDCFRKSQNRVLTIGESTFFNIQQDSVGCYARNSKRRKRVLTIGEETIFENSAWQLVRRQKSMIFNNIAISIGESTNSEQCKRSKRGIFKNIVISIGESTISEIAKTWSFKNWLLSIGESTNS